MKKVIEKTRQYLDYIETHYNNVQKAWKIIQKKGDGSGFDFLYDDFKFFTLDQSIKEHDLSKLSHFEFEPYRKKFYPTEHEKDNDKGLISQLFEKAWEHHYKWNDHHWENWTKLDTPFDSLCVVHNYVDWMAMSMKFGDSPMAYYEKNKGEIIIPDWAESLMYDIDKMIK